MEAKIAQQQVVLKEQEREIKRLIDQNEFDLELQKKKFDDHIGKMRAEFNEALQEKNEELEGLQRKINHEDSELLRA